MKANIVFFILFVLLIPQIPHSQDFWQPTNGPYGGSISTIVIDANDDLYTGTNHGVYRSTDDGENWELVGLIDFYISALIVDSKGDVFAGTGKAGVFRSNDSGKSWENVGLIGKEITCFAKNSLDHIFSGTGWNSKTHGDGIFRLTSDGMSWDKLNNGLVDSIFQWIRIPMIYALVVNSKGHIFAGTDYGIYYSENNGEEWMDPVTDIREMNKPRDVRSTAIDSNDVLFVGDRFATNKILRSTDNGKHWDEIVGELKDEIKALAINHDNHIFAGVDTLIFRSVDHGANWTRQDIVLEHVPEIFTGVGTPFIQNISINSKGHLFLGTCTFGVFKSVDNGEFWAQKNIGICNRDILSLAINPNNNEIFAGSNSYIFRSSDNGLNWIKIDTLFESRCTALYVDSNGYIFAGTFYGNIFFSKNNGHDWKLIFDEYYNAIVDFASNSAGHLFFSNQSGVYRFSEDYSSYTKLQNPPLYYSLQANDIAMNSYDHIFVGGDLAGGGLWRSEDNGKTWAQINKVVSHDTTYFGVNSLGIDSNNNIYAGTSIGLFFSSDNGKNFRLIGFDDKRIGDLFVNSIGTVFLAVEGSVFYSPDSGNSWIEIDGGLGVPHIYDFVLNSDGYLYAGTPRGVYKSIYSTTTAKHNNVELPRNFILHQNYPNPFNSRTTIPFFLSRQELAALRIYNLKGELIKIFPEKLYHIGDHELIWDCTDNNGICISSGIYIAKLSVKNTSKSIKITYLK